MTKRRTPAAAAPPTELPPLDQDDSPSDAESFDLDSLAGELSESPVVVVLSRVNDREPTQWDYLDRIAAPDFTLEAVKQQYGGGRYRGHVLGAGGRNLKKINFRIDPRFKPAAVGEIMTRPPSSELQELRSIVAGLADVVKASLERPPRIDRDPFELAIKMTDLITRSAPAPAAPAMGLSELLKVFQQGVELGRESSEVTGGDPMVSALKHLDPLIQAVSHRMTTGQRQLAPGQAPTSSSSPAAAAAPVTPAPPPPMAPADAPAWVREVTPHLPRLVALANSNAVPENWAAPILDALSEPVYAELAALSSAPDFADQVIAALPALKPVEAWSRELCKAMAEIINAPE